MQLRIQIDFEDFMKLHGEDKSVFPFNPQARELIYDKIVDLQQHHIGGCATEIDWSDSYCYANEWTEREVWENNEEIIENNARDLLDIAASYKSICNKLGLDINEDDDEDYRYDIDIISDNKNYLLEQEGFLKEAVQLVLSKLKDGFAPLDDGNWLVFGE